MKNIAVLIPVKSIPDYKNKWVLSDLYIYFCKSFFRTYSPEHNYIIYLGYQDTDPLYSNEEQMGEIKRFFNIMKNTNVNFIKFDEKHRGNVVGIWNRLFTIAMTDGNKNEYFIQCGSDIQFIDNHWVNEAINKLMNNDNYGVVGLQDKSRLEINPQDKLLTQSIVSYKHYFIFNFYYPYELKNWFCDDFLTEIYEKHNWVFRLRHGFYNMGGVPRYEIYGNRELCDNLLSKYKNHIDNYLSFKKMCIDNEFDRDCRVDFKLEPELINSNKENEQDKKQQ